MPVPLSHLSHFYSREYTLFVGIQTRLVLHIELFLQLLINYNAVTIGNDNEILAINNLQIVIYL